MSETLTAPVTPTARAAAWLARLEAALAARDSAAAAALFDDECYWRDLVSFTWNLRTEEGRDAIREMLDAQLGTVAPSGVRIHAPLLAPPQPHASRQVQLARTPRTEGQEGERRRCAQPPGSSDGTGPAPSQARSACSIQPRRSRPWRRQLSIAEKPRATNCCPRIERVGPLILRLSTTVRSACSAALLVGSTPGWRTKVHSETSCASRLAQVCAVRRQPERVPRSSA